MGGEGRDGKGYIARAHHILKDLFNSCNEEYQGQRDDGGVPSSRGGSGNLLELDSRGRGEGGWGGEKGRGVAKGMKGEWRQKDEHKCTHWQDFQPISSWYRRILYC